MDKVRIHEIAKELGLKSKEIVEKANDIGLGVKSPSSSVSPEEAEQLMNYIMSGVRPTPKAQPQHPKKKAKEETGAAVALEVVKQEAKKPQIPSPKEGALEEEETLAQTSAQKRRGLVIVKKKRAPEMPAKEKEASAIEEAPSKGLEARPKKKKVKKPVAPAPKKEISKKIDLLVDRDIKESAPFSEEESEVVLLDLSDISKREEEEEKARAKKLDEKKVKVARPAAFVEQIGISRGGRKKRRRREIKPGEAIKVVEIPENIRVYEFAEKVGKSLGEVIKVLFNLGLMVTKNDFLDKDTIEILAEEFDVEVKTVNPLEELDYVQAYDQKIDENFEEKPPVITIMGHVDHGKTSLLDRIRASKVAEGEAGGITQAIGAYMIQKGGKKITFIDTPGHEAFTQMRARGAKATDIAVIVVAADDGVMPQTVEAIDHAKAAKVPIIVAINKMDKPEANPDLVKTQLAEIGISPIEWGGEYEFIPVSARTGQGIDLLLDTILMQAEIMELKANPNREAKAIVIESSLDKGRGPIATVIVQNGTLKVGDNVVAGTAYGRIRAILGDKGQALGSLLPGEPGVVIGLNEVPPAGEILVAVADDKIAREYAAKRAEYVRQKELSKTTKVSLDELSMLIAEGELKTLPLIIKTDTQGSLEAIRGSLEKIKSEEVKISIIHTGVGGITESDVALASASENAVILGFNVRPTGAIKEKAKNLGVEIKTYSIIYNLLDDVKALLSGMLSPVVREETTGQAEVREVFVVPKIGAVAGCMVTDGTITRGSKARVIRDGVVIYSGSISSLKRFKEDAREVAKGYECGLMIANFNDIKAKDIIETYKESQEKATL